MFCPLSRRWQPEQAGSAWRATATGYERVNATPGGNIEHSIATQPPIDWLAYEHEQAIERGGVERRRGPILDDLAYNQDESRELVAVPDVLLRCRMQASSGGVLWLRVSDGRRQFVIRLDAGTGDGELTVGQERPAQFSAGPVPLEHNPELVLAAVDAQLRLTLAGRLLFDQAYDPSGVEFHPTDRPLAIGAQGLNLRVSDLMVLRDVYYLADAGSAGRQLGADEYWLLGDNSAVSRDSRIWPHVYANSLIGKVLAVYRR